MAAHDWIDIAQLLGLVASAVIAAVLGARLSRHDAFRKEFADLQQDVENIKGYLKGKFGF